MTEPVFAAVFADQWHALPPVMRAHYANRPHSHDRVTVEGMLTVRMAAVMKPFAPILAALGMLTPWTGEDVPCIVHFLSEPDGDGFIFDRHFRFPGKKPCRFRSRLVARGAHDVIEYMACGIGWRCGYSFEGGRVVLSHKGYVLRLFGVDLPLPGAEWIIGRGEAYETPEDDTSFSMFMGLQHWLFGWLYRYEGRFTVTEMALG